MNPIKFVKKSVELILGHVEVDRHSFGLAREFDELAVHIKDVVLLRGDILFRLSEHAYEDGSLTHLGGLFSLEKQGLQGSLLAEELSIHPKSQYYDQNSEDQRFHLSFNF